MVVVGAFRELPENVLPSLRPGFPDGRTGLRFQDCEEAGRYGVAETRTGVSGAPPDVRRARRRVELTGRALPPAVGAKDRVPCRVAGSGAVTGKVVGSPRVVASDLREPDHHLPRASPVNTGDPVTPLDYKAVRDFP
ncbi:hypothetical protein ACFYW1_20870 [Streptomyces sp. NPDC002669]|uniref:hypothetical protein n=1 Tax=Streptomyces sp. NPDC002669 TaxID=3364658 RepID=UPI0036C4B06D